MSSSEPPPCDLQVDFPFDYAAHLAGARRVGTLPRSALGTPVAVIGAGGSGLTAAYELMRIGCRPVLYEAERDPGGPGGRRLGGRMYSLRVAPADSAVVELGCMRFPSSARLLRKYVDDFGLPWEPCRDGYAADITPRTVLEVDGRRHEVARITDLYDRDPEFAHAHRQWLRALDRLGIADLRRAVAARDLPDIRARWADLVARYEPWTFHRFLRDPDGCGLTHDQTAILGAAGIGPGLADSFFHISFLESLRMLLAAAGSTAYFCPLGISELAQRFWTHRTDDPTGRTVSLEQLHDGRLRPAVSAMTVDADPRRGVVVRDTDGIETRYAAAIFTPQLHLLETNVELSGTPFGPRVWRAIRRISYWQAAKTALLLRDPCWQGTSLDGVTLTDRLPRAAYTFEYGPPHAPGGRTAVLELGYAWGPDAMKLAASDTAERKRLLLRDLTHAHPDLPTDVQNDLHDAEPVTISWENQRNFRGLCRLSRPGEYPYQQDLFRHFLKDFPGSPTIPGEPPNALFLAGDDTAWSPGWLDHALASGVNAAWGVTRFLGGTHEPDNPGPGDMWMAQA
ncbi:flavin monoamine oxidase family protein [Nocardia sp. NPDC003482]